MKMTVKWFLTVRTPAPNCVRWRIRINVIVTVHTSDYSHSFTGPFIYITNVRHVMQCPVRSQGCLSLAGGCRLLEKRVDESIRLFDEVFSFLGALLQYNL